MNPHAWHKKCSKNSQNEQREIDQYRNYKSNGLDKFSMLAESHDSFFLSKIENV